MRYYKYNLILKKRKKEANISKLSSSHIVADITISYGTLSLVSINIISFNVITKTTITVSIYFVNNFCW